jgi:membrane-associated phospholipid phosphatase
LPYFVVSPVRPRSPDPHRTEGSRYPLTAVKTLPLALLVACYLASGLAVQAQTSPNDASSSLTPREEACYSTETEPLKPLGKKFVKNFLLDQKDIWTSPFHMKRSDAKWWLLFGTATGALIATDHWTSRQLPNTNDQTRFSARVSDVGALYTVVPVTAAFYLGGVLTDNAKARETGLLGAEALADGLVVFEVLKLATQRQRPLTDGGHGQFFHGGDSFPSGHTMAAFALASVIAHEYRNKKVVPVIAYGLATLVGATRFSARKHFASDVVAAGAMGWFVGTYVFETNQEASRSRSALKAITHPQVIPQLQPGGGYGISLAWHP